MSNLRPRFQNIRERSIELLEAYILISIFVHILDYILKICIKFCLFLEPHIEYDVLIGQVLP